MADNKFVKANEKIAESVVTGYQKIESGVVDGYKKIEEGVVGGYKKIEEGAVNGFNKVSDKFVEAFFTKEGETAAEAKARLARQQAEREAAAEKQDDHAE